MNFANVEEWLIPEGDVKKVTDSQDRIIWQKDTYDIIDHVYVDTNKTGIIIPISLRGGIMHELGMDFQYVGDSPTSDYMNSDIISLMGNQSVNGYDHKTCLFKRNNATAYGFNSQYLTATSVKDNVSLDQRYQTRLMVWKYNKSSYRSEYGRVRLYDSNATQIAETTDLRMNHCYKSGSTFQDVNTYWGFGVYSDANGNVVSDQSKFTGFIYECWLKVDDEYVCHLFPAIRNRYNQYGLYDIINDVFYPSCTENEFTHVTVPIQSMSLSDIEVAIGKSKKVPASFVPIVSTPNLTWSSADTSIATVDSDGYVTGISRGNTTITATDTVTGISASCNVFSYIGTSGLSLSPNKVYVSVGGSVTVAPIIYPSDADYKTVNWWIQSNPSTGGSITLNKNSDQTATITGVSPRTVSTITVRAQAYDGQLADAIVWVSENSVAVTSVSLNKTSASIGVGGTEQLIATVKPDDATSTTVTWTTSNSSVATVSSSGLVTGRASGTATITASCGGKQATCTVTIVAPDPLTGVSLDITSATLTSGDTITLTPTASPSTAGNVTYTWTSSNTSVATVNSSGKVTAVGNGTATITCTGHGYNSTASATCSITVATIEKIRIDISASATTTVTINVPGYGSGTGSFGFYIVSGTPFSYTISAPGYVTYNGYEPGRSTGLVINKVLTPIAVTDVTVEPSTLTLDVNDTSTLSVTITPTDALNKTITWSSSNTDIATVNNSGKVTASGTGTAIITATSNNGISDTCNVTVRQISVTGITLDKHSVTVGQNDVVTLTATISPDNASNTNINIGVSGASTHVTSTTHDGNVWTINWKADANAGQAQITVTTVDGSYSDTCTMSIISVTPVTGVSLNKSSLSLDVNNTSQLTATVSPSNATNKSVSWTSSDNSVATVSSSGLVTAVGAGTTTITVTTSSGGYTATCKVTVTTPVTGLALNTTSTSIHYSSISNITKTIVATITPSDASNKKVTWSSSNTDIVTVTQGGVIHGEALGTATITCKSVSNPSVSATCTVTVLPTITISPSSATLTVGETKQLAVSTMPSGITVHWVSDNINVATVLQNGLVEAESAGTANITAGTNSYGWSNASVITVLQSGSSGKSLTITNDTGAEVKYGKSNSDSAMSTLGVNGSANINLTSDEILYILKNDSNMSLTCLSDYTTVGNSFRIRYADAIDGETIHVVVS